jgi:hypothetical protein
MGIDLPLIYAVIIIFGITLYGIMDGLDLGIETLFLLTKSKTYCDVPALDGNKTWLEPGAAALFGAFLLGYTVVLPAFFLALIVMFIGLSFRDVTFKPRFNPTTEKNHRGYTPLPLALVLILLGHSRRVIRRWSNTLALFTSIRPHLSPTQPGLFLDGHTAHFPLILSYTFGAITCSATKSPIQVNFAWFRLKTEAAFPSSSYPSE